MAASPRWKVYNASGEYIGSVKYVESAAAMLSIESAGATIRDGHKTVVYTVGADGDPSESYDAVVATVHGRV
ncbi:MAG: hypothetical protein WC455_13530 [Dehalococcoidia bacterium]